MQIHFRPYHHRVAWVFLALASNHKLMILWLTQDVTEWFRNYLVNYGGFACLINIVDFSSDRKHLINLIIYRLLQNRVSAQRFRQKRKSEFENLKDNLRRLIQENEMLRNQVSPFWSILIRQKLNFFCLADLALFLWMNHNLLYIYEIKFFRKLKHQKFLQILGFLKHKTSMCFPSRIMVRLILTT